MQDASPQKSHPSVVTDHKWMFVTPTVEWGLCPA